MSRVVIVGGVAGGATAAGRIRRLDPEVEITMLEKGDYISFANCGLPYYIGGKVKTAEEILFETPESFGEKYNIDIRINNEVIDIDTENKEVTVFDHKKGEEWKLPYDKLLLSMGAEPIRPDYPGIDLEGVFSLRTYGDGLEIREFAITKKPKRAVVVGSGFVGLEMVENFVEMGIEVSLIQRSEHIFSMMDSDLIGPAEETLKKHGVDLKVNTVVDKIEKTADGLKVTTDKGDEIEAGIVLMAIGVLPENDIAEKAGLELGFKGGIVVDKKLQTSAPDVYAIGDVIEVKNYVSGKPDHIPLAGPAHMQARVVAKNITGTPAVYKGSQGSMILKLFETSIALTGISEKKAKDAGYNCDTLTISSPSHATYYPGYEYMTMKIVYEKPTGKILGAQIIGGKGVDKRGDIIAMAIYSGMTVRDLEEVQLVYAPPYSIPRDIVNVAAGIISDKLDKEQNE